MFGYLFPLVAPISLGVDCGGYNTKVSIVKGSAPPEIYHDSQFNPNTPTFLAFRSKTGFDVNNKISILQEETVMITPEIGDKALKLMENRPIMGSGFFPRFIDLKDSFARQLAAEYLVNTSAARVLFNDLFPLYYKQLLDQIKAGDEVTEVALVVPSPYTMNYRAEIQTLMAYAGYERSTTLDEVDALAYAYALDKMGKFMHHTHTVLFIDFAGTAIRAYMVSFQMAETSSGRSTYPLATRLSYVFDNHNGGVYLTNRIVAFFRHKLNLQDLTPAEMRRLVGAAERLKQELATGQKADIFIQEIHGLDHRITVTLEEYREIARTFLQSMIKCAQKATGKHDFKEIEIVGGASRVPFIDEELQKVFKQPVRKSLDPDEIFARGAGIYLQYVTDQSTYPDVRVLDQSSIYNIKLMTMNETYDICEQNKPCPHTFEISGDNQILMTEYSGDAFNEGFHSSTYGIFIDDALGGTTELTFHSGPFFVFSARGWNSTFHQSLTTQPVRNPMGATKIFNSFFTSVSVADRIKKAHDELYALANQTLREVDKNKSIRFFTNHNERLGLIRAAEKAKKWLNSKESESGKEIEFLSRLRELKTLLDPVYQRLKDNSTLYDAVHMYQQTLNMARHAVNKEWPVNKTWLPKKIINNFVKIIDKTEKWYNESVEITKKTPGHLGRPIKGSEWNDHSFELFDAYKQIEFMDQSDLNKTNRTPVPTPEPTPTPTPEPKPQEIIAPNRGDLTTIEDFYLDTIRGDPAFPRFFGVRHPDENPPKITDPDSFSKPKVDILNMDDL